MLKNIQIKILLIFLILGILFSTLVGLICFNNINLVKTNFVEIANTQEISNQFLNQILLNETNVIYLIVILLIIFV